MTRSRRTRRLGRWVSSALVVAMLVAGWVTSWVSAQAPDTLQLQRTVSPNQGVLDQVEFEVKLVLTADKTLCPQQAERKPVDVILVVDHSDSMSEAAGGNAKGTKLDQLKVAAKGFLGSLDFKRDQMAVVEFNAVADVVQELTQDPAALGTAIDGLVPDGMTLLDTGLTMALREFESGRGRADATRVIIMLTDGLHGGGTGILSSLLNADPVVVAQGARAQGIRIVTIGLGEDVDAAMLTAIASQPEDYYPAPTAEQLPAIYKKIGLDVIAKAAAASNVIVEHTYDPGIEVIPDSIQPAGALASGKITWQVFDVLDAPVTLSYRARPLKPGIFNVSAGDSVSYQPCGLQDSVLTEPAGLQVQVAPPPTPTPTNTPTPTVTPIPTRTPMPTMVPAPTPSGMARTFASMQGVLCLPNLWPIVFGILILLFIIWWVIRFWRELQKQPDPNVRGSGPNPCPLWFWWFLPIVLFLLALLLPRAGMCQANQSVYFWRIGNGSASAIYVTDVEGRSGASEFRAMSQGSCVGCHNVSPQGGRMAAVAGGGVGQVIVTDLAGNRVNAPSLTASYVALSPDGRRLAISDENRDIRIVDLSTGVVTPLAGASDPAVAEEMPAWSPDASEIAFVRGQASSNPWTFEGPCDIYVVPVAGGAATPLVGAAGDGFNYYPAYSPDGQWIAFTRHTTGSTTYSAPEAEIFVVPSVGGERKRLAANDDANGGALTNVSNSWSTWSLDGKMIAFTSKRDDPRYDIFVAPMDANGNSGPAQRLAGAAVNGIFEHLPYWGEPPEVDPWAAILGLWPWLFLLLLPILAYLLCKALHRAPPPPPVEPKQVRAQPGRLESPPQEPFWQVAPTLVVGLGGTGRWVLTHLKKTLRDAGAGVDPKNVKFILLDTSEREQTNLFYDAAGQPMTVEFAGVSLQPDEIYLMNQTLAPLVEAVRNAPDVALTGWFPAGYYRQLPTSQLDLAAGTHGRRPMARAGLIGRLRAMKKTGKPAGEPVAGANQPELFRDASGLWEALVAGSDAVKKDNQVRILVVGSVAGGMGGALADVAYLARRASALVADKPHVEAYLTLPRAYRGETVNPDGLAINAVAALREIERFQLARGLPFPMQYSGSGAVKAPDGAGEQPVKALDDAAKERLFDDLTLFSEQEGVGAPKGKSNDTWATTFASMADVIALRMDMATRADSDYREATRGKAENKQQNTGRAVVSGAGSYVYRLPLADILEIVHTKWALALLHVFLNGDSEKLTWDASEAGMKDDPATYAFKFVTCQHEAGQPSPGMRAVGDLVTNRSVLQRDLQDLAGGDERGRRYNNYLGAALGLILNGYLNDEQGQLKRRTPRIGYAQEFCEKLVVQLRKAAENAQNAAQNTGSGGGGSLWNRILTLFGRGKPSREEYLAAADQVRRWAELTQRSAESLKNLRQLLMGTEAQGGKAGIAGLYTQLAVAYREAEGRREQMDLVPVRRYLWSVAKDPDKNADDPKNQQPLYDLWYDQLVAKIEEQLPRFYWYTAPEGTVRLGLVLFEQDKRVIALDDRDPHTVSKLANELYRLAQHLTSEWAKTTRLMTVLPTIFPKSGGDLFVLEQTWRLSAPHLRMALDANQELDGEPAAALGLPAAARNHATLREFVKHATQLGGSDSKMASGLKPAKTKIIDTSDGTSMILVREFTQMPLSHLPDYEEAWQVYRRNAGTEIDQNVESPALATVFAAERNALEFERRLEASPLNQDFRLLDPLVVLALARPEQVRLYALAFAAGWVKEGPVLLLNGQEESLVLNPAQQEQSPFDYRIEGLLRIATAAPNDPLVAKLAAAVNSPSPAIGEKWRGFFDNFRRPVGKAGAAAAPAPAPEILVCENGHAMRAGAKFCGQCRGARASAVCVNGHPMRAGAKFCGQCGGAPASQPAVAAPAPLEAPAPWRPGFGDAPQAVQDLAAVTALFVLRRLDNGESWDSLAMKRSRRV